MRRPETMLVMARDTLRTQFGDEELAQRRHVRIVEFALQRCQPARMEFHVAHALLSERRGVLSIAPRAAIGPERAARAVGGACAAERLAELLGGGDVEQFGEVADLGRAEQPQLAHAMIPMGWVGGGPTGSLSQRP